MKKFKGESRDRLSELPHSLILHILSSLPMKDVVRTTILSKLWKNLWTTIPCLSSYGYLKTERDAERIRNFVNSALGSWKGKKIMKFEISFHLFDISLAKDVDVWVRFAKEYNVEELNINLKYKPEVLQWDNAIAGSETYLYVAPQCLNSCSLIKKLSLVGCNLRVPESPAWNQLLSLSIDWFCFSEGLINRVLYGAPQLEVFTLRLLESYENLNIQSTSLKKLKIEKFVDVLCESDGEGGEESDDEHPSTNTALRIKCPNLEVLEIAGFLFAKCVLTIAPSLTDVSLKFEGSQYYDNHGKSGNKLLGEVLRQIFSAIQHVEKVTLSDWCVQMLVIEDRDVHGEEECFRFEEFIGIGSNLPNSFPLQLRTIEITSPFYGTLIYGHMEYLLKFASMLEKMVVWTSSFKRLSKESFFEVAELLLSMPRSSKTAKVILRRG